MRIIMRAAGHIRRGPEREMVDDYVRRAQALARGVGYTEVLEQQVDLRACKTRQAETERMLEVPSGSSLILLDERGKNLTTRVMTEQFVRLRDTAQQDAYILIGAADGWEPACLPNGAVKWAFGAQTWPHKLARVMLSEQIYRCLSILSGTPYHRD